ncbi:MAG: ROK family protein [bacterium]|nr:ROK family protein [bacterium]
MRVLVIDIGGSSIKLLATGQTERTRLPSSSDLTPDEMVSRVKEAGGDWTYDVVSIGYPGPVEGNAILVEPKNLGDGWVGFDFGRALGRPVKIVNDAAMQAIGSYQGDEMLFLGLGTGLGSALIAHGALQPLELAHLPYNKGRTYEDYLGKNGLKKRGKKKWREKVFEIVPAFHAAFQVDYVVLGGGNAKLLDELPPHTRRGGNALAFEGGFRLWDPDSGVRVD